MMLSAWLALFVVDLVLVGLLVCRDGAKKCPFFLAYIALYTIDSSLALLSFGSPYYTSLFYALQYAESIVLLATCWELLQSLFFARRCVSLFTCATAVSALLFSSLSFQLIGPRVGSLAALRAIDSSLAQVCLVALVLSIVTARYFKIPWRSQPLGIAIGLLTYLLPESALRVFVGFAPAPWSSTLNQLHLVCYLAAALIWTFTFLRPSTTTQQPSLPFRAQAILGALGK